MDNNTDNRGYINLSKPNSSNNENAPIREAYPDYSGMDQQQQIRSEYRNTGGGQPQRQAYPEYTNQTAQTYQEYRNTSYQAPPVQHQNVANPPVPDMSKYYNYGEQQQPNPMPSPNPVPYQQPVQAQTKFCKHCGGVIPKDAVVCTLCGRQVEQLGYNQQPVQQVFVNNNNNNAYAMPTKSYKSKVVALLLSILFGYWGIHRFYAGKIGSGLIYLFTFGLFGIGYIVDIILIATGNFTDSNGLPLKD